MKETNPFDILQHFMLANAFMSDQMLTWLIKKRVSKELDKSLCFHFYWGSNTRFDILLILLLNYISLRKTDSQKSFWKAEL